jgi:hypothetical protein
MIYVHCFETMLEMIKISLSNIDMKTFVKGFQQLNIEESG